MVENLSGVAEQYPLSRQSSSIYDYEDLRRQANEFRDTKNVEEALKKNLMFEEKNVNLYHIYRHLAEPIDYLYMFLGFIGSIGAGVAITVLAYLNTDVNSGVGNTSEYADDPIKILENVKKTFDNQIKRYLIISIFVFVCNFLSVFCWVLMGSRMCYKLRRRYFTIILLQEQGWFDSINAFEFSTKVQAQLEQIEMGIGEKFGQVITGLSQCIVAYIFAFIFSWKLTLVTLCLAPLVIIDIILLANALRTGIIMSRRIWEKAGGFAEEMLYNIKTVASFANFEYEIRRYNEKVELCYQFDLGTVYRLGLFIGIFFFLINCINVIAFFYGRTLVGKDINSNKGRDFTGGDVMAVSMCSLLGVTGIGLIAPNLRIIQESCTSTSDYFTLYEREPQMDFSQSLLKPPRESVMGKIEFRDVKFIYPSDPNKKVILNNLNLVFEPGKKVAIVGESGCGKSTTVNLIERLYESSGGEILIDGIDIKQYDIKYLRSLIGYVQQEPVLFNESIKDNIIFGRREKLEQLGNVDELIQEACDESYATEFISKLPDQLDYVVGIKGNKLSGGQKQRVAIARAILAKPKILILDEATSSLDNKSEKEVQRALNNISQKNVTTIIIAHRLSSIKNADLIYAIKNGHVIEQGTHKQLLELNGYYAGLVRSQLAQDEIETKEELELQEEIASLRRRNTDEEVQFQRKDYEIYTEEEAIKVNPCRVIKEITRKHCCILILAIIGAVGVGALYPINGYIQAFSMNALNSMYETIRYDDGLKYALIELGIAILQGIFHFLMNWMFTRIGATLTRIYRKKALKKYLQLHISFYDIIKNSPGALLTRLSIDTMQLNYLVMTVLGTTVQCGMIFILSLIIGCFYDYRLILVMMFVFIPIITVSMVIRRILIRGTGKRAVKANVEAGAILSECVTNTKTIYSFNFQQEAVNLYMEALEYNRRQFIRDSIIAGFFVGLGQFSIFAGHATVLSMAKHYIINMEISSDDLTKIINIVMTSAGGIGNGLGYLGDLKKANIAFKSIYSILDTQTLINPFRRDNEGKVSALNIKGKIELRNVYFAYPTRPEQVILKDVSLTIYPGQNVALVGYSGSGKSTIIQLLTRFYDVEDGKGEILIDDVNIKDYNLYELRKKIGLVSQEPVIFKRNVLENIRYGKLDATDEECIEAARQANITQFFNKENINKVIEVQNKKDTSISPNYLNNINGTSITGTKEDPVSGGEKQRLCIARAFLKNPTILLLDEATSALDKENEELVQASLDKLAANRTSISVAHRLNTIEDCDQIFVLENGRLVEQGNHDQLMTKKNKYYILHKYSNID